MSEEAIPAVANGGDVTASAPAASDSASQASNETPATGVFDDANFDSQFGLEPETQIGQAPAPDAPAATDAPSPRQGEEVKTEPAPAEPAPDAADKTDKTATFEFNDKLNWDDEKAPKQFREEFKQLKEAFLGLSQNDIGTQFVTDPTGFAKWMEETSPTSFQEVGTQIATESAKANPGGWIDFLVNENADLMAEKLTGRPGMTADRLKAELAVLSADDEEDVKAEMEKGKQPEAETEGAKEIREFKEEREKLRVEREQARIAEVTREVFAPVETAVDELISEAGLDIDLNAYQGKNFAELDEDTQFKVMVNEFIPVWIDMRVHQDPRLVNMQSRLEGFLNTGDKQSALALQHHAKIAATNFAGEALSILTAKRAASKAGDSAPAPDSPKPHISTAGTTNSAIAAVAPASDDDMWTVTEADMRPRK